MSQEKHKRDRKFTVDLVRTPRAHRSTQHREPSRTDGGKSQHISTPQPKWTIETSGRIRTTPAVDDATVYVGSNDGMLYAIDRDTGTQQWHVNTESVRVHAPTIVDGTLYAASGEAFAAFDPTTGDRRWTVHDQRILEQPVVTGDSGFFYAVDREGWRLHAIDTETGTIQWTHSEGFDSDTQLQSNIMVTDHIVCTATWSALRAFDRETGESVWSVPHEDSIESITHDGNVIYCGSRSSGLTPNILAIDTESGEIQWKSITRSNEWITAVTVSDHRIFAAGIEAHGDGTKTRRVTAVSAHDGEILWRSVIDQSESSVPPRPVAVTDDVVITSGGQHLTTLAVDTGTVVDRFDLGAPVHAEPIVVDGTVYIGNEDGAIAAYANVL